MNTLTFLVRFRGLALTIAGSAAALVALSTPINAAGDAPTTPTVANAAVMPLKVSFAKDASEKNEAPMIVHLKNDSAHAVTVSGNIDLSVVVHNRPKSRAIPSQTIEAGAVLTIDNLAPDDKITLSAENFAPLVVVVPYKP